MPNNPVTWVSPNGGIIEMNLHGLFVTVHIGHSRKNGKTRIIPHVEATNPSSGRTYSGYDVLPVTRRRASKIAAAIYRDRTKKAGTPGHATA